jgi:signal transduction histidine kinase
MDVVQSVRRDLGQPTRPVDRDELPFLIAAAVVVIVAAQWNEPGTSSDLVLLVVGGLALVALAVFPRVPIELVGAAVLGPVSIAIGHGGHLEVGFFLVVTMTLYAAWHLGSTVRAVLIAVVCCVVIIAIAVRRPDSYSWEPWTAAELFTLVLGRTLFRQRSLIMQLESTREALADRAVAEERTRIARELHDVAGHTLAAMLLHITGARHVLRRDINDAEQALVDAETVGRSSMDQIRAVVAALRTTEHGTDPPLADGVGLHHLVEQYRRAGLLIDATITPDVAMLDGPVGIAVHRITREALANVARHAPTNRVELCVATNDKQVAVRVADHGRRAAVAGSDHNRFGLLGMTERARALGGTLVAEPSKDGWCVEATLPFTSPNPSEVVE